MQSHVRAAIASLDVSLRRYMLAVVLPCVLGALTLSVVLPRLAPGVFSGWLIAVPLGIPLFTALGVFAYPFLLAAQRGHVIDHNMHYFITHIGTLATSRLPPVDLFATIGKKDDEYGPLAEECAKIAMLVKDWNMSLSSACRFVARRTPSVLFSDFLERFAFGIESGTDVQAYLMGEQVVVMSDYETVYKETLHHIEDLKGLFNGSMMTLIFLVMFVLMMVVLVDLSPMAVMLAIVLTTVLVGASFLMLAKLRVPPDSVWVTEARGSPLWDRVKLALPLGVVASVALGALLWGTTSWPDAIIVALAASPLVVPGWLATREEERVKRRDDNYPGFMRSLGSSAAARGGDDRAVLRHLQHHDFGPLTDNIRGLFKRLHLRIDDEASWHHFTTEAGSRLIERFTQMYDEAADAGGKHDEVGRIISDNMIKIISLRKLRYQHASSFRGTVFSIAVGTAFALSVGIGVLEMLTRLFGRLAVEDVPIPVPEFVHMDGIDVPVLQLVGLTILVINAAISSVLVRIVDGGTHVRDLQDFALLVWVSSLTAWGSGKLMTGFLSDDTTIT